MSNRIFELDSVPKGARPGESARRAMADSRLLADTRIRRALESCRGAALNFDPSELPAESPAGGWHYDERLQPLPREDPGDPAPHGSWEVARRLMRGYEFADPSMVRAYYDPGVPLERRVMLLEVRFFGFRVRVGCRVAEVYERAEAVCGREAVVWGWSYRTLEGHFEQGEMHWQVVKWPASGEVAFRIRAWSRPAADPNVLIRLGFRVVGRREQLRFYDSTCERMSRLTTEALGEGRPQDGVREVASSTTARHAGDAERHHDLLARNVDRE